MRYGHLVRWENGVFRADGSSSNFLRIGMMFVGDPPLPSERASHLTESHDPCHNLVIGSRHVDEASPKLVGWGLKLADLAIGGGREG
jgi:hypothetical protein